MDVFYQDTVTIYNRYEENYVEQWYPTVLKGVQLLITKGANMVKSGLETADSAKLFIQLETLKKVYILPKEWEALEDHTEAFTLRVGDFFVEGDTSLEDSTAENFARHMKQTYDNCFEVTVVDTYRAIPHLEVGGK